LIESNIISQQNKWHSNSLQGCIYAAYIIRQDTSTSGSGVNCFRESLSTELIIKIKNEIDSSIEDETTTSLRIILPSITTKENLIEFVSLIKNHTNWLVSDSEIWNGNRLVKMRIPMKQKDENEKEIVAWVLGFGPFTFFPKTRQSPFFEIIVPVKTKYFFKDKHNRFSLTKQSENSIDRGTSSDDAHLADVYIAGITDDEKRDKQMWENSRKRKSMLLTEHGSVEFNDSNAKAKITFSIVVDE